MNKKSQAEIVFGAIGLAIIISGLLIGSLTAVENSRYFGDSSKNLVYDKTKCNVNDIIKSENLVKFNSLDEAHNRGYNNAPNCI